MKVLFLVLCLGVAVSAMAEEVKTDCPAMNQSREKIIKPTVSQSSVRSQSTRQ